MNLETTIQIYADHQDISQAVRKVFTKKTGKGKGYDAIEQDLQDTIKFEAERLTGEPLSESQLSEVDSFIKNRLDFLQTTFKGLNDPMKNKSDERAALVGQTEDDAATWFGRTKGYEWSGRAVKKVWQTVDPCEECAENEEEGAIAIGEEFPSGDFAPPAHPNCNCYLDYVEDDDEDDEE